MGRECVDQDVSVLLPPPPTDHPDHHVAITARMNTRRGRTGPKVSELSPQLEDMLVTGKNSSRSSPTAPVSIQGEESAEGTVVSND